MGNGADRTIRLRDGAECGDLFLVRKVDEDPWAAEFELEGLGVSGNGDAMEELLGAFMSKLRNRHFLAMDAVAFLLTPLAALLSRVYAMLTRL